MNQYNHKAEKYVEKLIETLRLQKQIEHLHPMFQQHYPIVIAENKQLHILDYHKDLGTYTFRKTEPDLYDMPRGVRAAFPLECYDNRPCIIVSGDVFNSKEEQLIIFHEAVHCYQYQACEMDIRAGIELAQSAIRSGNYMWELNYPFPYQNPQISSVISGMFDCFTAHDETGIKEWRKELRTLLTKEQHEYMVWQEWKEGLARFFENLINQELGVPLNHAGKQKPYTRVSFYALGAELINMLEKRAPGEVRDIHKLYDTMESY